MLKRVPAFSALLSLVVFLGSMLTLLLVPKESIPSPVHELLITFLAVALVHLVDTWIFRVEMAKHVKSIVQSQKADYLDGTQESLRKHFSLLGNADQVGLVAVYKNRKDAVSHVYEAIHKAEKRVWIMGIALTLAFKLDADLLGGFRTKLGKGGFSLRILLLDALRSPAVFRTFLESAAPDVKGMLETDPADPFVEHPYFNQQLFTDYQSTFAMLSSKANKDLQSCVRYYAHSPSFWMLIVDDEIFLEPYTFGRPSHSDDTRIGGGLPVFRFRNLPENGSYEILCDHYEKLWSTSDIDLFQEEARRSDRAAVLKRILARGDAWFRNAVGTLYFEGKKSPGDDRRAFPRYTFKPGVQIRVKWSGASDVPAQIKCISGKSIRLTFNGTGMPLEGAEVGLLSAEASDGEERYMVQRLWRQAPGETLVARKIRGNSVVLMARDEKTAIVGNS